jgi:hypothetical protein
MSQLSESNMFPSTANALADELLHASTERIEIGLVLLLARYEEEELRLSGSASMGTLGTRCAHQCAATIVPSVSL